VAENTPNKYQLELEIYMRDQTAPIVHNIEHVADANFLKVRPALLHIRRILPLGQFGNSMPGFQRSPPFGVVSDCLPNTLWAYDSHCESSQIVKFVSS
jgi:hypothetical protein